MTLVPPDPRIVWHTVRVRHAVTERPVPGLAARLVPPTPWWWAVATKGDQVVVHAPTRYTVDDPALTQAERDRRRPIVRISVGDPLVAATITNPTTELTVTADATVDLTPVQQTVTVVLTTKAPAPATGHTVRLVPPGRPAIGTDPVPGSPGTYRTDLRAWAAVETPFDLEVDGQPAGRFALEPFQTDTRLHAVLSA